MTDPNDKRRGPGTLSYIAGMALTAIAGFAVAQLLLAPPERPQPAAQTANPAAQQHERASAATGTGLENLVVHDSLRSVAAFEFIDSDGKTRTLADWRGKTVLVNIWATWCAPCKEEMPALSNLQAKLGGDDFAVVPISVDRGGLDKPRQFLEQIGANNLPLLLEESGRLNVKLDVIGLPATLIIDGQGHEIARMIGPAEWDSPQAISRLRQLMAR